MRLFYCPLCSYSAKKLGFIKAHFVKRHSYDAFCYSCNKRFKDAKALAGHARYYMKSRRDEYHVLFYYLSRSTSNRRAKSNISLGKYVAELISVEL